MTAIKLSPKMPEPGGHFRHVVRRGNQVFVAGQVGRDSDRRLAGDSIEAQTRQTLTNLALALDAAGAKLSDLCLVNAYLADVRRDFAGYDRVYREFFGAEPPARVSIGAILAEGILVEISGIAVVE